MRWIFWSCSAALVVALQATLAPQVQIGPIRPDWPFLMVVAVSLTARSTEALYVSALVGAIVDASSLGALGTFTFVFGTCSALIVQVREYLFRNALATYGLVTLLAGLLVQGAIAVLRGFQDGAGQYEGSRLWEALCTSLYTAAWSLPGHWLFLRSRRLLGISRRRRPSLHSG